MSFNKLVLDADREAHEREARADGRPDYRITEREAQGKMVPARRRDQYVVVEFIEPHEGNEAALGFDVASESRRLAALSLARESSELAITASITLVQEHQQQFGFLGFIPVYREDGRYSRSGSAANLEGFVVGVFRLGAIVERALAPLDPVAIDVIITDESAPVDERFLYASTAEGGQKAVPEPELAADTRLHRAKSIELGGKQWQIAFVPTSAYLDRLQTRIPLLSLLAGLAITLLATAYLVVVSGHSARVARLVEDKTGELRRSNRALETEIERRAAIEWELSNYRAQLEDRVRDRTAELESTTMTLSRAIKQREAVERALAQSEERLRLTLGAVADGAWDWNIETGEVFFSDSWIESLGYDSYDVKRHVSFWESIIHPDDRAAVKERLDAHLEGRTPHYECENRLRKKSGEYRWNLDRGQVVARDSVGRPLRMVGTDTDISARKVAEEQQLTAERELQQTQKLESLGVLAGGIAHDFNNLLVAVLGGTDLALEDLPADAPARRQLEKVRTAATRAADLIRQIHAYSGHASFLLERIDVPNLIEEMSQLLHSSISKKARLRCEFADPLPAVEGDATQIRQVVMNLITNASDALGGESGEIVLSTSLHRIDRGDFEGTPFDQDPGDYVCVEVTDNGCGMGDEIRERIFEPFFSTKAQGQGLGLAATLGIVRSHRGFVQVRSAVGLGTTIRVLLPPAERLDKVETNVGDGASERWEASGTALVVDDDPAVRDIAERMLRRIGLEVLTADDGVAGVETFREHADEIAVTLLDMTMPLMDGADALQEIRRIRPDAKVLLSSGYSERISESLLVGDGRADFVQKPYRMAELREKLKSVIDS